MESSVRSKRRYASEIIDTMANPSMAAPDSPYE